MARRLIHTETVLNRTTKVYRDAEWEEYRVVFYIDGKKQPDADYHTDDKKDAYRSAISWTWAHLDLAPHGKAIRDRVVKFAKANGTGWMGWRGQLVTAWWDGTDASLPDGHLLRIARNQLGPEWLKTFKPIDLNNPES